MRSSVSTAPSVWRHASWEGVISEAIQLELPLAAPAVTSPRATAELFARLEHLMDGRLTALVLTTNRSTFLSARPHRTDGGGDGLSLRLHRCFVAAPDDVLVMVARYCAERTAAEPRRRALAALRTYFDATGEPEAPLLRPSGRVYDLVALRDEINASYFDGRLTVDITWGRRGLSGRRRIASVQLGAYYEDVNLIRVHPVLDRHEVPRYVVAAVVFHELLHAALPARSCGGRRAVHTAEFRRRERRFRELPAAEAWIEAHLFRLLSRAQREARRPTRRRRRSAGRSG